MFLACYEIAIERIGNRCCNGRDCANRGCRDCLDLDHVNCVVVENVDCLPDFEFGGDSHGIEG